MWRACLLVVVLIGLFVSLFVWGRGRGMTGTGGSGCWWGGEPGEVCNSFALEIPMPKTQVSGEAYGLSFTFKHALWPGMDSWDLYIFDGLFFSANGIPFRISGGPATEGRWFFSVSLLPPFQGQGVDVIFDLPEEGYEYAEIPVSVTPSGMRLRSETYQNIIGKKSSATHSKEIAFTDSWFIPSGTEFTVAAGDGTMTVETTEDITVAGNLFISGGGIDADDWYRHLAGQKYAFSIEDIRISGQPINTNGYAQTTWGGTPASVDKLWVEGFGGNSIGFWSSEDFYNGPYVFNNYEGGLIRAPFSYDFSQYKFLWMDDTPLPSTLEVYCTGLRKIIGDTVYPLLPWKGTIGELAALGRYTQKHGCYYWSAQPPDMQASVALYLSLTSAEAHGIEIRGPRPEYKVEGAGFGQTVDTETEEVIPGPVDGQYAFYAYYNGEKMYSNGSFYLYCTDPEGPDWAIGPGPPVPPYYTQDAGGPAGAYLVNTTVYEDSIIDEETGQRQFSGFAGEGIGPAVSADTTEAILVDSDCAAPSFKHDATCCFDAWPLSATSRTASPYMTDVVSLTPVGTVGVYADAHTHEDWVGENATTPDSDGDFVVGSGADEPELTITNIDDSDSLTRRLTIEAEYAGYTPGTYVLRVRWYANPSYYYETYYNTTFKVTSGAGTISLSTPCRLHNLLQGLPNGSYTLTLDLLQSGGDSASDSKTITFAGGTLDGLPDRLTHTPHWGEGGAVTLTLKCNYRDRQAKVGGVDEVPVPTAYLCRRHDSLLGEGATPEEHEARYDWRGFYLAQAFKFPSLPATVTCTIEYYDDLGGVSDNHKTDSTRQTEYAYDPGELLTLTREIEVSYESGGWSTVLVDLFNELEQAHPLALVKSLQWTLPAGAYTMNEPQLLERDTGDRQELLPGSPGYRQDPGGADLKIKIDESWMYAQGKVSAHIDGHHDRVLFVPDHNKPCQIEKCFDTLNVLIGAKTGEDLTSNYLLSDWPVQNSSERWVYTHSAAAEEAHLVDEDDAALVALRCYDLMPQMAGSSGALPVAVRCAEVTAVAGLPYTFYGRKYCGGRAQGFLLKADLPSDYPRARSTGSLALYRRPLDPDDPTVPWQYHTPAGSSDAHGRWQSAVGTVWGPDVDIRARLWEYGIQERTTDVVNLGRFATREWAAAVTTFSPLRGDPFLCRDFAGNPSWLIYATEELDCRLFHIDAGGSYNLVAAPVHPLQGNRYKWPSVAVSAEGAIIAAATDTVGESMVCTMSRDGAASWEAPVATLTSNLQGGTLHYGRGGLLYASGWYNDKVWLAGTSRGDLQREVLDGIGDLIPVCDYAVSEGGDPPRSTVVERDDGALIVAVEAETGATLYTCENLIEGFAEVT